MALQSLKLLPRSKLFLQPRVVCSQCRAYADAASSALSAPPLLFKLRTDLKTAMKAKDTNRLNVLKTLIADVTNSAKTSNPIKTDMQLLSLLRKRAATAKETGNEFKAAGREDLVEREEAQAAILEEYAGSVETMSEGDMKDAIIKTVEEIKKQADKVNMGDVLKKLLGPGGYLDGKPVERSEVARIVKQTLAP